MSTYTIPNVITRSAAGERVMDVYSHLLAERIVYLGTAIDSGVANALIAQLLHLEADNPEQEISLYVNSEGGDLSAMLAVYDTMRFIKAPVATTCIGQAVAAGAVLLAAGTPGRRAVLPHSRIVLHQPAAQGRGTIPDLILQADEVVRVRGQLEYILARHTGRSAEQLRLDTDRDRVFDAHGAVNYGLADLVLEERS
ncbi:ClpP family protease [Mycolicibacterium tokaiense]|uniref:ATP-dependent Clp protease proteolytic subunit n=1 Tax=Mycolicibacterium tokaiense TaxID=39695 RepID=A0A378TL11_9MYCO|nr:ATP-dependent Clp protease proteolytic subunit [Mycolicibacterium tokaiense]BBY85217.1 putative ATP-dependent Clp protease proteolytic subunit-like protein [Mycolicibacterium tokaiense]STZ60276.1 ATP-dependent Clp protease proteolytic subunit [Mycolicibacterium tokaiense]